jgi:transposase
MTTPFTYVGIDVSKDKLDIAIPTLEGKYHSFQLANSLEGFAALLERLPKDGCSVMEATGAYHCRLAFFLAEQGQGLAVVNPLSVKHFSRLQLLKTKTDKADAVLLASYGQVLKPPLWQPPAQHLIELPASLWCAGRVYQTANGATQSEPGLTMNALLLKQSPGRHG